MRAVNSAIAAALGLSLAAIATTVSPVQAATPAPAGITASTSGYAGSTREQVRNEAFYRAVMTLALARQRATGARTVSITYDDSAAPTFRAQISQAAQIWNSSVANVRLEAGRSGADFTYEEGSSPDGSYADTDGHGRGFIFLDFAQNREYNSVRVVTHETGHVLGLPDDYQGPCSELMSGGGPGPSCQNTQPDSRERSRVNALWANGLSSAA